MDAHRNLSDHGSDEGYGWLSVVYPHVLLSKGLSMIACQ